MRSTRSSASATRSRSDCAPTAWVWATRGHVSTTSWAGSGLPAGTSRRYAHELSGGMRQRVMIAMALTHDPPLLILDEPTSALDVSVQAQIMNLLKELKWERGISMLFITHDLALASDLCDRIVVVYAGQVREVGPADDVLVAARDPYTRGLLASMSRLHGDEVPTFLPGLAARSARAADRVPVRGPLSRRCSLDARSRHR